MTDIAALASDFLAETRRLAGEVRRSPHAPDTPTLFKGWSTDAILRHLHTWNEAARLSLTDEAAFTALLAGAAPAIGAGGLRAYEDAALGHLSGEALVRAWLAEAERTADAFAGADPDARLPWVGPPMSAASSLTARLMESWAHGQAVFDANGVERADTDAIRPIAELGVRTFGWTYAVRGEPRPATKPHVRLTTPSGAIWAWNDHSDTERIEGPATAFCQVVTQTRNVADTALTVTGAVARDWMSKAQCFAGGPETPPPPGLRRRADAA